MSFRFDSSMTFSVTSWDSLISVSWTSSSGTRVSSASSKGSSNSAFSVLCHGFPTPLSIAFAYSDDKRPVECKLTGFTQARYAHAVTDLQILLGKLKHFDFGSVLQN